MGIDRDIKEEVSAHVLMINLEILRDYINDLLFKWDLKSTKFTVDELVSKYTHIKASIYNIESKLADVVKAMITQMTDDDIQTILEESNEKSND